MIVTICDICKKEIKGDAYKFNIWKFGECGTRRGDTTKKKGHICIKCLDRIF